MGLEHDAGTGLCSRQSSRSCRSGRLSSLDRCRNGCRYGAGEETGGEPYAISTGGERARDESRGQRPCTRSAALACCGAPPGRP